MLRVVIVACVLALSSGSRRASLSNQILSAKSSLAADKDALRGAEQQIRSDQAALIRLQDQALQLPIAEEALSGDAPVSQRASADATNGAARIGASSPPPRTATAAELPDAQSGFSLKSTAVKIGGAQRAQAAQSAQAGLREALGSYYATHNPEKAGNIDAIVAKYGSKVSELSDRLQRTYGEPLELGDVDIDDTPVSLLEEKQAVAAVVSKGEARSRLLQLYAKHQPSKLPFVDTLLEIYDGREADLMHEVENKFAGYGESL